jgi:outer membrane lipoprotein SlyB
MNTPHTPSTPHSPATATRAGMHPLLLIAAVAVILFCAVGTAAIMGWLPKSNASGDLPAPTAAQLAPPLAAAPVAQQEQAMQTPAQSQPGQQLAAADTAPREPVRAAEPAPAVVAVPAAPAVCKSCGVVESVRTIEHRAQGSGVGAAGGAILGGLLGNQVGGGHGRQLATVAGAVGGAVAGNQIEGHVKSTQSWQITVRMDNGNKRTFNYTSQPSWHEGDDVKVVNGKLRSSN